MEKQYFENLDETVYSAALENGLRVLMIPKKDFAKTYGIFTTNFGSIDNTFVPLNGKELITVPDGIAHFLEHKLFEGEEHDAFDDFARYGASANAFTSFTRTSYLFSATDHIKENVLTLLDFVQSPHFTPEGTEKEKGIIAQEINMYEDEPGWRLFYGLLKNLYPEHPVSIDIAGTVESIQQITPENLMLCYETFYHPSNMNLLLIGNIDPEEMLPIIEENQSRKSFAPSRHILRTVPAEKLEGIISYSEEKMDVQRPKVMVGIRGIDMGLEGQAAEKTLLAGTLLMELLFGRSSIHFNQMYDEGLIDDSFSYSFNFERSFNFLAAESDTSRPEELIERLKNILLRWNSPENLDANTFELLKKSMIGEQLQAFNSLEYIANQYGSLDFVNVHLFDRVDMIESLTMADIVEFARHHIQDRLFSAFVIQPKKEEQA